TVQTDTAISEYLSFLKRHRDGSGSVNVYETLQRLCTVTETTSAPDRKLAIERNTQIIKLVPHLEWAHYFLGMAFLLESNVTEAEQAYARALELNPERA